MRSGATAPLNPCSREGDGRVPSWAGGERPRVSCFLSKARCRRARLTGGLR